MYLLTWIIELLIELRPVSLDLRITKKEITQQHHFSLFIDPAIFFFSRTANIKFVLRWIYIVFI